MYNNIDELIEANLNLILESHDNFIWLHEFIDIDGKRFRDPARLAEFMQQKGLIEIEITKGQRCDLTEVGYKIGTNGGWIEFLKASKLLERQEQAEKKLKEQADLVASAKLENEYRLSKWKLKTFWWIFGLAVFSGLYSIYDIISNLTNKEVSTENTITKQEMESELSKLRTLILTQKNLDSLSDSKTPTDSLDTKEQK